MITKAALVLGLAAAPTGDIMSFLGGGQGQVLVYGALMLAAMYFLAIRPQQLRAKEHATRVGGIKRGDTVILSSGLIGKVVRVEDAELGVEIAQNVTVKVIKTMVSDVRSRGEPVAANDSKS